jgi:subtilase family serine protease
MSCLALVLALAPGPLSAPARPGLSPAGLQAAYDLPSRSAGRGQTVAVIDAYNDPHAASDLAAYRAAWRLPECTVASGCFRQVNQEGRAGPLPMAAGATGWAVEESLDLDMVSAVCPNCRILLVEADSNRVADLGAAVDAAVALGAKYVSNGYAGPEFAAETADNSFYDHPGTAVTAGAGDEPGQVTYPAAAPYVTSVGGTTLSPATGGTWSQQVWTGGLGTGSGCSAYEPRPAWQAGTGCAGREDNDVAAVAAPRTGVAVYDSYDPQPGWGQGGWMEVGGTGVSSAVIASVYALAGPPAPGTSPASYPYADTAALHHVPAGSSCAVPRSGCPGTPGYNGPAGWGTPDGTDAFTTPAGRPVVPPDQEG